MNKAYHPPCTVTLAMLSLVASIAGGVGRLQNSTPSSLQLRRANRIRTLQGTLAATAVLHIAPPAKRVPVLMADLFQWLQQTDLHPLVASSIFHYEFEFIHPFDDGNGRMGRLWQSLLLYQWNPVFQDIPIESMIFSRQQDYYQALNQSTQAGDSAPFLEFMLQVIHSTLDSRQHSPPVSPQVAPQVSPLSDNPYAEQVKALCAVLHGAMSRAELMAVLGLSDRKSFRLRYLQPALQAGVIEMTLPDKPNSRLQKYRGREGGNCE